MKPHVLPLMLLLTVAALGVYTCAGGGFFAPGAVCSYLLLMLFPGAGLYLLVEKKPRLLELFLSSIVVSPVITGLLVVGLMSFGLAAGVAAMFAAAVWVGLSAVAVFSKAEFLDRAGLTRRQITILAGVVVFFCVLVAFLPFTREWWRVRSDAWFHTAVIFQIADYGIPPEDPYFHGMPLQYMWFYHVLVLVLSRAMNIHVSFVMPLLNVHAIIGFILATFLLSFFFRKRFAHGISSVLTAILGISALFWLFVPLKLSRAFTGEVRGMDEVSRLFVLNPFDFYNVRSFLYVGYNQVFFLDKFTVMTPFSLGLCFMAAAWYGLVASYARKSAFPLILSFFASAGMLAFHTVVGIVMVGCFLGALALLLATSRRTDPEALRTSRKLFVVLAASVVVLTPYLYLVMHGKESSQLLPFGLSFTRTLGILVSCALGFLLAAFQVKRLLADRTPETRFFTLVSLLVLLACLLVVLPGPNKYDKPPFFIFYPLSVVGGWTFAEIGGKGWRFFSSKTGIVLWFAVLFLPVNILATVAYVNTSPRETVSPLEREVTAWVRANTTRDAVFIDHGNRVFLAVTGPRRYYFGRDSYADQWGYDKKEMDRRRRVKNHLYSKEAVEKPVLAPLSEIVPEVYVIVRKDVDGGESFTKLSRVPDILEPVFSAGPIMVLRVDKAALGDLTSNASWSR